MADLLLFLCALLLAVNLTSILIAAARLSPHGVRAASAGDGPPVSIVIPVRGIEAFTAQTLRGAFQLDWQRYELIFCVADHADPIIPVIEEAIAGHPAVPARILVGDDRISANPKLNNCVKGWRAASFDWVVLVDSNVLMPPDYVQHLMEARRPDTGLVCSTPLGTRPHGFWAEVECAFLNSHQARWQYAGEALGLGFAQGKSMLWHKPLLDANGGIEALAADIAEDAAATKLVSRLGLKVNLVASPFEQPLGERTLGEVWRRQGRWARLRRVTFPAYFAPEILLGAVPVLLLALAGAALADASLAMAAFVALAAVYLPELALARARNWHVSILSLPAMLARDVIMPLVWLRSWLGGAIEWRGNTMIIGTRMSELEGPVPAPARQPN